MNQGKGTKPKLYTLLVGINDYPEHVELGDQQDPVVFPKLFGCADDARKMNELMHQDDHFKVIPKLLLNKQATRQAIIDHFRTHLGKASAGDSVLFYFSGHGAQEKTTGVFPDETDNKLECLACYYDKSTKNDFLLADKELRWLIYELSKTQAHILTIADCCHSADNTRNFEVVQKSFHQPQKKSLTYVFPERSWKQFLFAGACKKGQLLPEGPHVALSACQSDESAVEWDGEGVFTKTLLKLLRQSGGNLSYQQLGTRVRQYMLHVYAQRPKIYFANTDNRNFLGRPGSINKQHYAEAIFDEEGNWKINAGALQHVQDETEFILEDPKNIAVKIKARVDTIGADFSYILPEKKADKKKIYRVNIDHLMKAQVRLFIDTGEGDLEKKYEVFQKILVELPDFIVLVEDSSEGEIVLRYENHTFYLSLPDAGRPINLPVPYNANAAALLLSDLHHISQWNYLKTFARPGKPADIQIGIGSATPVLAKNKQVIPIQYEMKGGKWKNSFKAVIQSKKDQLYCCCLYLCADYSSHTGLLPGHVYKFEKGETVAINSGVSVDPAAIRFNLKQYADHLKFIFSTEPFDCYSFQLEPLVERTRGAEGIKMENNWWTWQVELRFENPVYKSNRLALQP